MIRNIHWPRKRSTGNEIHLAGRRFLILLAVIPTIIFYVVWLVIPMGYSLLGSLYEWNPLSAETPFVGLQNFAEALGTDPLVGITLRNTLYYVAITVPIGAILALLVAVMINSLPRLVGLYRVIYFQNIIDEKHRKNIFSPFFVHIH